jgi:serpin B
MASLPPGGDPTSIREREALVLDAVRRGIAQPITWAPVKTQIPGHTGVVYVATDTLRFGVPGPTSTSLVAPADRREWAGEPGDWNWVRIAVTADTAQKIADQLGVLLPTDKILDLAHAQADVHLTPHVQMNVTATTEGMLQHHVAIEAERAGREGLISTIGKDWILGNELCPPPWGGPPAHPLGYDGAINYGWHTDQAPTRNGPYVAQPGIVVWQSRGLRHNRGHVDYSQWVPRFVAPWMEVDGQRVSTADVMQSKELAGLVSYEGPLRSVRLPDAPSRKLQNRTARPGAGERPAPEAADPFDALEAGAPSPTPDTFYRSANGDVWIGTIEDGMFRWNAAAVFKPPREKTLPGHAYRIGPLRDCGEGECTFDLLEDLELVPVHGTDIDTSGASQEAPSPPTGSGLCDPFADYRAEHPESGVNAFGLALFARIRRAPGNLAFSPASIWTALAMPFAGARGETAEQMARTLDDHRTSREIVPAAGVVVSRINEPRPGTTIRLASRLFGAQGYPFQPAYLRLTRETFGAPLEPVDFGAAEAARARINGWVAEQTEDRIKDLLPEGSVDSLTRLVLVNAIYFLGKWAAPFEATGTRPAPFHASPTDVRQVPTMAQTLHCRFADVAGVKLAELPYRNNDLAMLLVLPAEVDGLAALEARLSPAVLADWVGALSEARVRVRLPKFEIAPEGFSLGAALKALGMPLAFDPARADFTGIAEPTSSTERLFLSDVFHKAFVKVDEEGTEAAAATAIVAKAVSMDPRPEADFNADHPFLFFLRDTNTGMVLFMGRVSDPAASAPGTRDAGEPLLLGPTDPSFDLAETGAPEAGSKVIDLGDHILRFVNSFRDAKFLGITFPGQCGGMASTVLDYFFADRPAPTGRTTPPVSDPLGAYIQGRQQDSLLFGGNIAHFAKMLVNPDDADIARQSAASFAEVRRAIDAGKPVLLGLIPHPWSLDPRKVTRAHQVVAHGYMVGDDGGRSVLIWDPNRPLVSGNYLYQAAGTLHWIEPATPTLRSVEWRGFFVEAGYVPRDPPKVEEMMATNDAGAPADPFTALDAADPLDVLQEKVLDPLHEAAKGTWLENVRTAQRDYLKSTWVADTKLGDFLRLNDPPPPAPPAIPAEGATFELYPKPLKLSPEAGDPAAEPEPSRTDVLLEVLRMRRERHVAPFSSCNITGAEWSEAEARARAAAARARSNLDAGNLDLDAGDAQGDQALAAAGKGAGIGAAVGTVLEAVPVVGPLLHVVAVVVGAIAGAIAGATMDTFHLETPVVAAGLVVAMHVLPNLLFSGIDTVTVDNGTNKHPPEEHAARLARYLLLCMGAVPNSWKLYNPNDFHSHDNPYMEAVDPRFPLTDPRYDARIKAAVSRGILLPPDVSTPAQAQALLLAFRAILAPSKLLQWSQVQAHLPQLRRNIQHLRALAGETGDDPELRIALGGDVQPHFFYPHGTHVAPRHVQAPRPAPAAPRPILRLPAPRRPLAPAPPDPFRDLRPQPETRSPTMTTDAPEDPFQTLTDAGAPADAGEAGAPPEPWRLKDPTWRPVVVREATAADLHQQGWLPAYSKGAKVFAVPPGVGGGWVDLGGRTAVGYYFSPQEPWRGASVGDSPPGEILPAITNGSVSGYPVDSRDWSQGILGEAGTWTYFRFKENRRIPLASGIRDVARADATTRENYGSFTEPITIYRVPADGTGEWVVVFTNRNWKYDRYRYDRDAWMHFDRTLASGVPEGEAEARDRQIQGDERRMGEPNVVVLRTPSDDWMEHRFVWDTKQGGVPEPGSGAYGMAPGAPKRSETAGAEGGGEPSSFAGGSLVSIWHPTDQRWQDVARTQPGPRGADLATDVGTLCAKALSVRFPGPLFVQVIRRTPGSRGVTLLVARDGQATAQEFPAGGVEPSWPGWTRASGVAPTRPRPGRYDGDGDTFASSSTVSMWIARGGTWEDLAEALPHRDVDIGSLLAKHVVHSTAQKSTRTARARCVRRGADGAPMETTLFACRPGGDVHAERFSAGEAPSWARLPEGDTGGPEAEGTPGNPADFIGGGIVSLWIPQAGRWEDVARTKPGARGAGLAQELGAHLLGVLAQTVPGEPVFGVVVQRDAAQKGMLLFAKARGGAIAGEWFPAGSAPHWPWWAQEARLAPPPRSAAYQGDADIFEHGSLVSLFNRAAGAWEDLAESRRTGPFDLSPEIAGFMARDFADRAQLAGLARYVKRDPRTWTGTVLVACGPGGKPREEHFPTGTTPTWGKLLSAGETGKAAEAGGPAEPSAGPNLYVRPTRGLDRAQRRRGARAAWTLSEYVRSLPGAAEWFNNVFPVVMPRRPESDQESIVLEALAYEGKPIGSAVPEQWMGFKVVPKNWTIDAVRQLGRGVDLGMMNANGTFQAIRGSDVKGYMDVPRGMVSGHAYRIRPLSVEWQPGERIEIVEDLGIRPIHAGNEFDDWDVIIGTDPDADAGAPPGAIERELTREIAANLALWCRAWPVACDPEDFGTPADLRGLWTIRGAKALRSFQEWFNDRARASVLPVDGIRWPGTTRALAAWASGASGEAGDPLDTLQAGLLDPLHKFAEEAAPEIEQARQAQRNYLKGTWVRDSALGRFLRLDVPDPVTPVTLTPEPPPSYPVVPVPSRAKPPRRAPSGSPPLRAPQTILTPEASKRNAFLADVGALPADPFEDILDVGDIDPAQCAALATLLAQLDRRFPFRGKGPLDGLAETDQGVPYLRVTGDPGRTVGGTRTGPDLRALKRAVMGDPRAEQAYEAVEDGARYLVVVAKPLPARRQDPSAWDLGALAPRGEASGAGSGETGDEAGFPWVAVGVLALIGHFIARSFPPTDDKAEAINAYRAAVAKGLTDQQLGEATPKLLANLGGRAGCENILDAIEGTRTPDSLTDQNQRSTYNILSGAFRGGEPGDLMRSIFRDLGGAPGARKLLAALYSGGPTADLTPLGQRVARTVGSKMRAEHGDASGPLEPWGAAFELVHQVDRLWPNRSRIHDGVWEGKEPHAETGTGRALFVGFTYDPDKGLTRADFERILGGLARDPRYLAHYTGNAREPWRIVLALETAADCSPWNFSGGQTGGPSPETAGAGEPFAALTTLLNQINARYPNRDTGRQDGIQTEGGRFALAITEDKAAHIGARLPSLAQLAAAVRADPRCERAELLEPHFWNSTEVPYLRIFTRAGSASEDDRRWNLSALGGSDTGEATQPRTSARC